MLLAHLFVYFQSLPPPPTSKLGPSGADSSVGGFVYILGPCGKLSSELSCEDRSFSFSFNPLRCFQSEVLRLYFLVLEPWVVRSVSLPNYSSQFSHTQMWDHLVLQPLPCWQHSPRQLPISAPPAGLDECFFNSLVVGLPYSSIFWQFWSFFVFKFVVVLPLVVQGSKMYLPMPLSWLELREIINHKILICKFSFKS